MTKTLREIFEWLIKEDDIDIISKLVPQLAELTEMFQKIKQLEIECLAKDVKDKHSKENQFHSYSHQHQHHGHHHHVKEDPRAYLDAIVNIGNSLVTHHLWRLEIDLMDGFARYFTIYNAKDIYERAIPFLVKRIKEGVNESKVKAIEMLVRFMRMNHMNSRSKDLLKTLNDEFFASNCFKMRQAYINIFLKLAETFSRHFIKQNVLSSIFSLAADKTAQVRRKLVVILPTIRKAIFHDDNDNLQRFNEIVNQLIQDTDKEVSEVGVLSYNFRK